MGLSSNVAHKKGSKWKQDGISRFYFYKQGLCRWYRNYSILSLVWDVWWSMDYLYEPTILWLTIGSDTCTSSSLQIFVFCKVQWKITKKCFTQYGMRVCEYCVTKNCVHHENDEKAKFNENKESKVRNIISPKWDTTTSKKGSLISISLLFLQQKTPFRQEQLMIRKRCNRENHV